MEYVAVVLQGAGVYCVPADDHCLYHGLLHYLIKYEKVSSSVDVRQLRKILADYLLANSENIYIAGDPITEWLPRRSTDVIDVTPSSTGSIAFGRRAPRAALSTAREPTPTPSPRAGLEQQRPAQQ